jgi:hypothetical protein
MGRRIDCDQCSTVIEQGVEPWVLDHPTSDVDDDGDPGDWTEEAIFCGPACLASWAMARAFDAADT